MTRPQASRPDGAGDGSVDRGSVLAFEAATVAAATPVASPAGPRGGTAATRAVCPACGWNDDRPLSLPERSWLALAGKAWLDGRCRDCGCHRVITGGERRLSVSEVSEASPCPDCHEWADR